MNNRVDYLSDRLVNLRGKLKPVDEVVPPDSIANGVSIMPEKKNTAKTSRTASADSQAQAQEKRLEQTGQLYNDLEVRLVRRSAQLEARLRSLQQQEAQLQDFRNRLEQCRQTLESAPIRENTNLSPSEVGECYRKIDRTRLEFFALESEIDSVNNAPAVTAENREMPAVLPNESFSSMLKKGLALALTMGMVIAAAVIIAALIIYLSWR